MQFLYPSEEETHKLLRFLLDNMAKCSDSDRDGRKTRGFTASGAKSVNSLISSALALNLEDSSSIENRLKLVSMEEKEEFSTSGNFRFHKIQWRSGKIGNKGLEAVRIHFAEVGHPEF
mgnify:CR=1 FL=1